MKQNTDTSREGEKQKSIIPEYPKDILRTSDFIKLKAENDKLIEENKRLETEMFKWTVSADKLLWENDTLKQENKRLIQVSAKLMGIATLLFTTSYDSETKELFKKIQTEIKPIIESALNNAKNI